MNYFIAWLLYLSVHSLLADDAVKAWSSKLMGDQYKYYRLIYNSIAIVGLVALLVWMMASSQVFVLDLPFYVRALGFIPTLLGMYLMSQSMASYNMAEFIGTAQLNSANTNYDEHKTLNIKGLNRYLRHPIYLSVMVFTLGLAILWPSTPVCAAVAAVYVYLPLGIYLEERKLIRHFGEAYLAYKRDVPAILPKWGK